MRLHHVAHCMSYFCMAMLSGCSTIFDAPADQTDFMDGISDHVRDNLNSIAQQQSSASQGKIPTTMAGVATAAKQQIMQVGQGLGENVSSIFSREKIQRQSPADQGREPEVYFEHIASDMPHFVILSAETADIWLDEHKVNVPESSSSHAFLISPGKYRLKVDYRDSPAFLADIWIEQHERITIRLDTPVTPQKTVQSNTNSTPNSKK